MSAPSCSLPLSVPHSLESLYDDILPLVVEQASLVRIRDARVIDGYNKALTEEARAVWRATVALYNAPEAWRNYAHVPTTHPVASYLLENAEALGAPSFSQLATSFGGTHVVMHIDTIEACVQRLLLASDESEQSEWVFVDLK